MREEYTACLNGALA